MEIGRTQHSIYTAPAETQAAPRKLQAEPASSARPAQQLAAGLPLEKLQAVLDSLPVVDLAKVAELKAALAGGEIRLDSASLAQGMLSYHRGSGA
ncbi:MAG: flagellar biosynthesis anti-sigma factor FlgM [Pseudomonas sp.]|uniref:flagellar biosynthesis anti-sigma factor FlgM n=1 Tax=Pseudomonas sp. TaxID=306 RepID=UPI003394EB72